MRTLFLALAQDVFAILETLPTSTEGQQPNSKPLASGPSDKIPRRLQQRAGLPSVLLR